MYINQARFFADMAHSSINQRRKYTNEPYIVHPTNVAYLVKVAGGTPDMIDAAYLHDVLEDVYPHNPVFDEKAIEVRFGDAVLEMVKWLTDINDSSKNRQQRAEENRKHLCNAPIEVQTIKLADLIDNSLTICEYDPDFAKIYLREKRMSLNVLKKGNPYLWNIADTILKKRGY